MTSFVGVARAMFATIVVCTPFVVAGVLAYIALYLACSPCLLARSFVQRRRAGAAGAEGDAADAGLSGSPAAPARTGERTSTTQADAALASALNARFTEIAAQLAAEDAAAAAESPAAAAEHSRVEALPMAAPGPTASSSSSSDGSSGAGSTSALL